MLRLERRFLGQRSLNEADGADPVSAGRPEGPEVRVVHAKTVRAASNGPALCVEQLSCWNIETPDLQFWKNADFRKVVATRGIKGKFWYFSTFFFSDSKLSDFFLVVCFFENYSNYWERSALQCNNSIQVKTSESVKVIFVQTVFSIPFSTSCC